jgi:hypothetical protein
VKVLFALACLLVAVGSLAASTVNGTLLSRPPALPDSWLEVRLEPEMSRGVHLFLRVHVQVLSILRSKRALHWRERKPCLFFKNY